MILEMEERKVKKSRRVRRTGGSGGRPAGGKGEGAEVEHDSLLDWRLSVEMHCVPHCRPGWVSPSSVQGTAEPERWTAL